MIFALTTLSTVSTAVAIEMFSTGAVAAITILCTGSKVKRSKNNGNNKKHK